MAKITLDDKTYEVDNELGEAFSTLKTKLIDSEKKIKEIEAETKKSFLLDKAISIGAKEDEIKDKSLDYIEGYIAGKGTPHNNTPTYTLSNYDNLIIEL